MDAEVDRQAQNLLRRLQHTPSPTRILVGIAGIPASGKSSFARFLTDRINHTFQDGSLLADRDDRRPPAILVTLDGWHYTRAQLDLFPDAKAAHDRRGSHWTFDSTNYVDFVRHLREDTHDMVISAPSFDHALKDPTPDVVVIHPYHRIVIIEGLYVFLSIEPWKKAGMMLDERCLIEVDPKEARKRLVARHVLTKITKDIAEANRRADENDIPNGHFVLANSLEPTQVIQSKNDPTFTPSING